MAELEDYRVFVGGLSWDTTDKRLEQAFRRFGKVLDAKIMLDRDTGRPRGFGFVTFADEQSMEDAIAALHNRELDGRIISVNKAQQKLRGWGDPGYSDGYDKSGDRGGYLPRGGGDGDVGRDNCFNCGKPGHWARECPLGGGRGSRLPPRYTGGGRNDNFLGGSDGPSHFGERSYESGPYGDRAFDRNRERYGRDRFVSDRYGDGYDRETHGGYARGGFERETRGGYARGGNDRYAGGSGRYGGGPVRHDRSFGERFGPYDRSSKQAYGNRY